MIMDCKPLVHLGYDFALQMHMHYFHTKEHLDKISIKNQVWIRLPNILQVVYSNQSDSNSSTNRYYLVGDSVAFVPSPNHLHSNLIEKQAPLIYVSTSKPSKT